MECTPEERALLDALATDPRADIEDLRVQVCLAKMPNDLRDRLVATRAMLIRADRAHRAAWEAANALGVFGRSETLERFYRLIESQAQATADDDSSRLINKVLGPQ